MTDPLRLHQNDALVLGRLTYTGLILLFFPLKSPRSLTALGAEHFHPPLGPFALFESYPPLGLINATTCATFLFFALWVAGWGKWIVGAGLTLCLTSTSGFFYSAGKIDHDFIVLLLPFFLTLPGVKPKRALLFCLAVYFASSGMAKAIGGWLDLNTQSTLSWALTYFHAYGKTEPFLAWSLANLPGWGWEILDQLTVWFELCVPLALLPPLRRWIVLAIPLFHLFTVLLFGIDFVRLLLVYLPLTFLYCVRADRERLALSPRVQRALIALCCLGLLHGFIHYLLRENYWSLPFPVQPPGLLLFPLFEAVLIIGVLLQRRARRQSAAKSAEPAPPRL
ncbi:MAG: hypothetical protein MK194_08850 [Roseibacillus sp.]|nr:hypothetical protein [Roseibacillus sp.]